MKILSFNVNGIRAIAQRSFTEDMQQLDVDAICLQETKATTDQVKEVLQTLEGYEIYANEAERKGYSGTAILTKVKPIAVTYDIGFPEHDKEGRVITLEFKDYYLVTVYTPNSGSDLLRLGYRQQWDKDFLGYLLRLQQEKPVVVCGDLNVAHKDIDLARPKQNYNKAAGYMQEEIDGMNNYHSHGFIDTFRFRQPDTAKYSWWSYRAGARAKNVGWRIDYFLVSEALKERVLDADIRNDIYGSDHCPVYLEIV
ncbi:MAG: exodeoxyribonuclease III [Flavobacteriia bacterium]|nr:exodeoxyribonuclease III [Flavobacteriia bacterium]OJX39734.1 MAG: exodeoxyribonuclease III [Flavobacteriia bacterium 40-80]